MNTEENITKLQIGLTKIREDSFNRDALLIAELNKMVSPAISSFSPTYDVRTNLQEIIFTLNKGLEKQDFTVFESAIRALMYISKEIYASSRIHEKTIQSLLSEESHCFGFKLLDLILDNIADFLDKELFPEGYELFTWFIWDNEFGKKNLSCWLEQGGEEFMISDVDGFVEFLLLLSAKDKTQEETKN